MRQPALRDSPLLAVREVGEGGGKEEEEDEEGGKE
jgi:hypothetical protein